jgi:hypothetical protein
MERVVRTAPRAVAWMMRTARPSSTRSRPWAARRRIRRISISMLAVNATEVMSAGLL